MNSNEGWHASEAVIQRYLGGETDGIERVSTETHLMACADCRGRLARQRGGASEERWRGVLDRIDHPGRPLPMRTHWMVVSLSSPPLMRATAALSVGLVVVVAVLAAFGSWSAVPVLLALAPLGPPAGAVIAFRPETDPAGAIAVATPLASGRLLYLRAGFAAGVALLASVLAAAVTPLGLASVLVWLLPGLMMSAIVVAAATWVDPTRVFFGCGAAWALIVGHWARGHRRPWTQETLDRIALARPAVQVACLAVLCVAVVVGVARRDVQPEWRTA